MFLCIRNFYIFDYISHNEAGIMVFFDLVLMALHCLKLIDSIKNIQNNFFIVLPPYILIIQIVKINSITPHNEKHYTEFLSKL